jgi:hypothetical protein
MTPVTRSAAVSASVLRLFDGDTVFNCESIR